jgi:hypothetical protein
MNLNHRFQPITRLPWSVANTSAVIGADGRPAAKHVDSVYIAHAANAYPKLVEMMRSARMELIGRSNMGLLVKHFEDLLRELGEQS